MYSGTNQMTVVITGGSGTISINGNRVLMEQVVEPILRYRITTATSHLRLLQNSIYNLINATNNGCDKQ
jgi:hypothetical protein